MMFNWAKEWTAVGFMTLYSALTLIWHAVKNVFMIPAISLGTDCKCTLGGTPCFRRCYQTLL